MYSTVHLKQVLKGDAAHNPCITNVSKPLVVCHVLSLSLSCLLHAKSKQMKNACPCSVHDAHMNTVFHQALLSFGKLIGWQRMPFWLMLLE